MVPTRHIETEALNAGTLETRIATAAAAASDLLPATAPLTAGVPQPPALVSTADWAGAALARLAHPAGATVGVLVGEPLVSALAASPIGELDLGAAVQPALDAAATALGSTAEAARTLEPDELATALASATSVVPLLTGETTAAVLFAAIPTDSAVGNTAQAFPSTVTGTTPRPGIEILHGVAMELTVEIGRTRMSVRDLLALTPGDVLELDRAAGSPADLLVNGRLIARGEVVVVDEDFALRVTEILTGPSSH